MKIVSTIFCEKLLTLANGRRQPIAILPGAVNLPVPPVGQTTMLPLCSHIFISSDKAEIANIEIQIKGLDGDLLLVYPHRLEFSAAPAPHLEVWVENLFVPVPKAGVVTLEFRAEGGEWAELSRLYIDFQADTAPDQPLRPLKAGSHGLQ